MRYPAGCNSLIASQVISLSGPVSPVQIYNSLEIARKKSKQVIHQMSEVICTAFSCYKFEDLYDMDWDTFCLRFAQAETKLIKLGLMKEPFNSLSEEDKQNAPIFKPSDSPPPVESSPVPTKPVQPPQPVPQQGTVITAKQMKLGNDASNWDKADAGLMIHETLKDVEKIFPEYIEMMKKGEAITPDKIMNPAQRKIRMEENIKNRESVPPAKPVTKVKIKKGK